MKKFLLSVSTLVCTFTSFSQDSLILVKQYNDFFYPTQYSSMVEFSPTQLIHAGQTANFGNNFWQTAGTTATTNTFLATSNPISGYMPTAITKALGKLFFISSFNNGKALYATDGTTSGIVKLCNVGSAITENMIINPKVANGKLFFAKDSSATGVELWATDGTQAGTQMVKDIAAGTSPGLSKAFSAVLNNKFYFIANDITNGDELWVTDGTSANTQMVYDLHSGSSSTFFQSNFFTFNNNLYFHATVSGFKYGLYKTDGTVGVLPTLESGGLTLTSNPMVHQNAIYFGAVTYTPTIFVGSGDLYSVTTSSPNMIADVSYTDAIMGNVQGVSAVLGSAGNNLFLTVSTSSLGTELWSYSSTTNSVSLLKDIATGTLSGISNTNFDYDLYFNNKKIVLGNKLVLVAQSYANGITSGNGSHQEEIWTSDGTSAGTHKAVSTFTPFTSSDYYYNSMTPFNGDVYCYGSYSTSSPTLWKLKLGITTSIQDNLNSETNFSVYPNPAKDILNITLDNKSNNNIKVIITNLLGESVLTETYMSNNISLKTNQLNSGVYFVTIENKGKQSTQKIIIE